MPVVVDFETRVSEVCGFVNAQTAALIDLVADRSHRRTSR